MDKMFITWKNLQKNTKERKKQKKTTLTIYNYTKSINCHNTPNTPNYIQRCTCMKKKEKKTHY